MLKSLLKERLHKCLSLGSKIYARPDGATLGIIKTNKELEMHPNSTTPKYDGLVTALNTQVRVLPLSFEEFSAMLV